MPAKRLDISAAERRRLQRQVRADEKRAAERADGPEQMQFTAYIPPDSNEPIGLDEMHREAARRRRRRSA